jgi:transposase-like protein
MAQYTEADIQRALTDIENGVAIATAATRHGIPRSTLRDRISGSQHHKTAHNNSQRLSLEQEEHLSRWILRQEALNYAPTHAQVRAIATGVLKLQVTTNPWERSGLRIS